MNEPVHYVVANEPVGFLFCGPTIWESSRTDRVATDRKLVTCPNCLRKLAASAAPQTGEARICDNCKRAAKAKDGRTDRGIPIGPCYCDTLRAPQTVRVNVSDMTSGDHEAFGGADPSRRKP